MFFAYSYFSSSDISRLLFPTFQHGVYTSLIPFSFHISYISYTFCFPPTLLLPPGVRGFIPASLRDILGIFMALLMSLPSIGALKFIFGFNGNAPPFFSGSMLTISSTLITSIVFPYTDLFLASANELALADSIPAYTTQMHNQYHIPIPLIFNTIIYLHPPLTRIHCPPLAVVLVASPKNLPPPVLLTLQNSTI